MRPDEPPAANPLGLSFGVFEDEALLTLRDRTVVDGVVIRALELAVAEVPGTSDPDGAQVDMYQRRSTRLRGVVLDISLDRIAEAVARELADAEVGALRLDFEAARILAEVEVRREGRTAAVVAPVVVGPGPHRSLRAYVAPPAMVGFVPRVPRTVVTALVEAGQRALGRASPQAARSLKRVGAAGVSLDVVDALMWAVMPGNGWKVPEHEDVPLRGVTVTAAGVVRIVAGNVRGVDEGLRPDVDAQTALEERVTAGLVREERLGLAGIRDEDLGDARADAVFRNLVADLDAEHETLVGALLGLAAARPSLHPELTDVAERLLASAPAVAGRASLALASVEAAEGRPEGQRERLVQAARALRAAGERRLAGRCLRAAAELAPDEERARLLEETIALRPDDVPALQGLIAILPRLGRPQAAVRATRRLGHLSDRIEDRVRAHLTAAALLRDAMGDPAQARRELERALKLAPGSPDATEALAMTTAADGDRAEGARLLQGLADRAEAEGDRDRAADLIVRAGDLLLSDDPEAALSRYERARELVPERVGPLAAMVVAARALGREALEAQAVQLAGLRLEVSEADEPEAVLVLRRAAARAVTAARGDTDEAVRHLRAALRLAPDDPETLRALAALHQARGESAAYAQTLGRLAARALADGAGDEAAELFAAQADAVAGDTTARAALRTALIEAVGACPGHRGLLDTLVRISVTPEARLDALDRRLTLDDPPDVRARLLASLAETLVAVDRPSDAARAYEEAVATEAAPDEVLQALLRLYRERDDPERLALALARAARSAPTSVAKAAALAERAAMLARIGRDDDAYAAAQAALSLEGAPPAAIKLATRLALRIGALDDARRYADARLASEGLDGDERHEALLDRAEVAERQRDDDGLISSLAMAWEQAEPTSGEGRQLAARLARALAQADRPEALADLERQRGRIASAPAGERAEHLLEAARLAVRQGQDEQAARDVEEALGLLGPGTADAAHRGAALEVQERLAQRRGDPVALAEVLGRRAGLALDADERDRLRLEQSEVLVAGGQLDGAVQALKQALHEQPDALAIAERLGDVAERAGQLDAAAEAFARAASLAEDGEPRCIEHHGRAAAAYVSAGQPGMARTHDLAVVSGTPVGHRSVWLDAALERLETAARDDGDTKLLVEVLGRRAAGAAPETAAALLLERAKLETERLGRPREGLDALRRARTLAPEDSEVARAVEAMLTERLGALGHRSEQAAVLSERADRASTAAERARLLLEASRIQAEHLDDLPGALARAHASVRADPALGPAREWRLALLRRTGPAEVLVDALTEEASRATDPRVSAELCMEAAQLTAPVDQLSDDGASWDRPALERALSFVRRAAAAVPSAVGPLEVAAAYTRALGRADEEIVILADWATRIEEEAPRARARLRRAMLLATQARDFAAAHEALLQVYDDLKGLALPAAREALAADDEAVREWLEADRYDDPGVAVLSKGLVLTRRIEAWPDHLRVIEELIHRSTDPGVIAELYVRTGDVLDELLSDPAAAETAYRSALRVSADHQRARARLHALFIDHERFGDLADVLGLDTLRAAHADLFDRLGDEGRRGLLAALVDRLPADDPERVERAHALASLELADPDLAAQGVARLRALIESGPRAEEASDRLLAHFDRVGDAESYCELLERRADGLMGPARAAALTALAEALETRLDDPFSAERALVSALDADPECEPARRRIAELCLAEDRFQDLATALGPDAVADSVRQLIAEGLASRARAFKAAAAWIATHEPSERTDLWLDIIDALQNESADDQAGLLALLRQQLDRTGAPEERKGLLLALAERLSAQLDERGRPYEVAEEAERTLRAVLDVDADQADAQAQLLRLYEAQDRYLDIGRALGAEALQTVRDRADGLGDVHVARRATEAMAQLSEGAERARHLLALIAKGGPPIAGVGRAEGLYRAALAADPDNAEAQEGFRRLLTGEGRYSELGALLGVEALRKTVAELDALDDAPAALPAVVALVDLLRDDPNAGLECTTLWVRAAELHRACDDPGAAELALRMALANHPDHPTARLMLRGLLISQDRLTELVRVDPTLLAEAVAAAEASRDVDLQVRGLRVLAEQTAGEERADLLARVGQLEAERGRVEAAEADLLTALGAFPEHTETRSALEALYWSSGRFSQAARALGPEAFMARAAQAMREDPRQAAAAVREALDVLPTGPRAAAYEMLGSHRDDHVDPASDRARRIDDLSQAQALWSAVGLNGEAAQRIRLKIVACLREEGDLARLEASVAEAAEHADGPVNRGALMLEHARVLHQLGRSTRALVVARRVVADDAVSGADRDEAARLLVDELSAEGGVRMAALERLVGAPDLGSPRDRSRWRQALARMREAEGAEAEQVVALLEAALPDAEDPAEILDLRQRLLALYDELGDWRSAEVHAAAIAQAEGTPEQWVTLSELRLWLDDRKGAKLALERAIAQAPSSRPANESLVRLAQQEGATQSVVARLEAWAAADVEAAPGERAARILEAARLAAEAGDVERVAELASRAVGMLPRHDPGVEAVLVEADALLRALDLGEDRVRLLTQGLGNLPPGQGARLRLGLADLLRGLGRSDEAATVVEQGLHREVAEDDELLLRLIEDVRGLGPEIGAKRLLAVAERLGAGPAARRLRVTGAELAEAGGDKEGALTAWSRVGREVGAPPETAKARAARLRITRDLDDVPALIDALVEAADDADNDAERASRLAEAAELADLRLDEPDRAEQLLRRAIQIAEDPSILQDTLLDLLRRHGRWMTLDAELARQAEARGGPSRAGLCRERAEILRTYLHDEVGAAALFVEAYEADPAPDRGAEAASALERAGDLEAAEALLDSVLNGVTTGSPAWLRVSLAKAEALERAGRVDSAIETLRRASAAVPSAAIVMVRQRQLLVRHRRWNDLADVLTSDAGHTRPIDRIRNRLAAVRILLKHAHAPDRAVAALRSALRIVQGWLSDAQQVMPDHVVPVPATGVPSVEMTLDSPLLDLAQLAAELGQSRLRVDALRLYAQSLAEGTAQQRALLLLAAAEREAGDLDAAEFTLRGAVSAIHAAPDADLADRVEADRALGLLLLDRDAAEEALEALTRAEATLRAMGHAGDTARAQILVKMAQAYRVADRPRDAVQALNEARLLDDHEVPDGLIEEAVEAAGPSEALADLLQKRAEARRDPTERAVMLREVARVWEHLGRSEQALQALLEAYYADPDQPEEAARLQELLYQAERWSELSDHLERRLTVETLGETERVALLLARAQLLDDPLGDPVGGLRLIEEAARHQPSSIDVLDALVSQAAKCGRLDLQQTALNRLAAATPDPHRVLRALVERAAVLERMDDVPQAIRVLEDALERALRLEQPSRALIDHLARLYAQQGDHASEARLWVRAAAATEGVQAAAYLARAADIRKDAVADRRAALATVEAALRAMPDWLSLRWSVVQLARSLGDERRALVHARQAADRAHDAGMEEAQLAFQKVVARSAQALGDFDTELEAWLRAVETGALDPASLDELVHRARSGELSTDAIEQALAAAVGASLPGRVRGHHRLARAMLLEDPLGLSDEAEAERTAASTEDGVEVESTDDPEVAESADPAARAQLERAGRWRQLAAAESAHAAARSTRPERARVLLAAGQRLLEARQPDLPQARALFDEALDTCPDLVTAWAERARLDQRNGDAEGAAEALDRLRSLGGAPWAPPALELAIARVTLSRGDRAAAMAAFARAKLQDPTNREAAAGLAQLAERLPNRRGAQRWIGDYRALLDETLDAEALAQLCFTEARLARSAAKPGRALMSISRALRLRPSHAEARQLRLEILNDLGESPFLLDAVATEAIEALDPAEALALQTRAFELARRLGDRPRCLALARALEEGAGDNADLLMSLYAFYRDLEDRAGLLRVADRLGGVQALGPLPRDQRVALATACFEAGRSADAFELLAEALPPSWSPQAPGEREDEVDGFIDELMAALGAVAALSGASDQIRLRAVLADLPDETLRAPALVRALEALAAWQPESRATRRLLASAYQAVGETSPKAERLYRSLLAEDPGDVTLLRALAAVVADTRAVGPKAILHWIDDEPALRHPWPASRPAAPGFFERLRTPAVRGPLGELLRLTAPALAGVLPPVDARGEQRRPAHEDPRVADVAEVTRAVVQVPLTVVVDGEGGESVELEPGDPSTLVVGEALAEDATPDELRFHVARAAMLAELGFMLVDWTHGPERRQFIILAAAAVDPRHREALPPNLRSTVDLLRARLDPTDRAAAEAAVARLDLADPRLAPWIRGALQTADRFGALMAGAPAAALRALYRLEPRNLAEPLAHAADRRRAIRRWRSLRDLASFVVSEDHASMVEAVLDLPKTARF